MRRERLGDVALFIDAQLDTLLDPNHDLILPIEILKAGPLAGMHWETKMSGVRIPENIAPELEKRWAGFIESRNLLLPEEISETDGLLEGAVRRISVNAYERDPAARQACLLHFGISCSVCGF
jgi:5-methylcytosine-specific restriction protein A